MQYIAAALLPDAAVMDLLEALVDMLLDDEEKL
jgi:hypothetical protein